MLVIYILQEYFGGLYLYNIKQRWGWLLTFIFNWQIYWFCDYLWIKPECESVIGNQNSWDFGENGNLWPNVKDKSNNFWHTYSHILYEPLWKKLVPRLLTFGLDSQNSQNQYICQLNLNVSSQPHIFFHII